LTGSAWVVTKAIMRRLLAFAAMIAVAAAPLPQWPFPGPGDAEPAGKPDATKIVHLVGSDVTFHEADFNGMARAIDWFPASHPPAPDVVLREGGGDAYPCGYCHLAGGQGRPENARLQGLPDDYIIEQVTAFANGSRRSAAADYLPTQYMAKVAHAVSASDLKAAAAYFSQIEPQSNTRVVEAASIPAATPRGFVYRFDPSRREALGNRIMEGPEDPERFERRDPGTPYVAYVPVGAISRGQAIAERGAAGGPACESCHGTALVGIAGASPSFLARQLMGFRTKTRNDASAAPMQAVAEGLTDAQIIDVAAYVGSHRPWTRAELAAAMSGK
jgi:cytochrome c553